VADGAPAAGSEQAGLLQLALSRPHDAIVQARSVLAARPGPYDASIAHQAAGIVLRDIGDINAGITELRAALRLARRAGSAEREADVLGSLGAALVRAGRTASGLAAFDAAIELSSGVLLGQVLHRRGGAFWTLGRYRAALDDLRRAVAVLEGAGDLVWTARALNARGLVYMGIGSSGRADADFEAAGLLYERTDQELESIHTVLNRGLAAFRSGDLPAALSFFDAAASRYRALNVPTSALSQARCTVLRAAGLASDALAEADDAVRDIEQANGWSTRKGELLLAAAACALAANQPEVALDRAKAAHRLYRSQDSDWQRAHSRLVLVQAQYAVGQVSGRLLTAARQVAAHLDELGSGEAPKAHLLAGQMALDLDRREEADTQLGIAARSRLRGSAISRTTGWLSAALQAEAAGQPRRMLAACRRGLEVLDEHRWTLGASELRAQATAHGAELAALALRHAAQSDSPRLFLAWTERWRGAALTVPEVRSSSDAELNAHLAALREITRRLERAGVKGTAAATLQREQRRLEGVVRARSLRARGTVAGAAHVLDVTELLDQLGARRLVEIVDVDGILHVLVCRAGQVRQFTAGHTSDAVRAGEFARFALRRLARGRPGDDLQSALAILILAGPQLQDALLGPAAGYLGDGPVVVVPPGKLHAIPWALLPALGGRVFSVAPSARAWMRAHAASPPARRHVTLACGPGLVTEGAEVPLVAGLYDDVTVLSGSQASAAGVLSALDGAWLGHIAAHGRFRADSPLFSSLRMHDGPLTVYDFEQMERAPYRLVLSSCDAGVQASVGADELLGLVASVLPLGTAGIVAPVVPLNDHAAVPLMLHLHQCLRAGQNLAESMYSVRQDAAGDPAKYAVAMSLLTLGAG
jgi:tetratricopeptide (TPR) repeat protein